MLWATLVLALSLPYVFALIPNDANVLTRFTVDGELGSWVEEIDSNSGVYQAIFDGETNSDGAKHEECSWEILSKTATDQQILSQIQKKVLKKIEDEGWTVDESEFFKDSFYCVFSGNFSRYRIYFWQLPPPNYGDDDLTDKRTSRIKMLKISYTIGNGLLRAR